MRVLGIDFGEVRIGLAISDPAARLALPMKTLIRTSDQAVIDEIAALIEQEEIGRVIIGEPRNADGSIGTRARRTHSFLTKLRATISLPCELVDERWTTVAARERLESVGIDLSRHPERIDAVAAQILLQQYLDQSSDPGDG